MARAVLDCAIDCLFEIINIEWNMAAVLRVAMVSLALEVLEGKFQKALAGS